MQKLLLVSNRLPITIDKRKGKLLIKQSVGGLATGLASFYKSYNSQWFGWCGLSSNALDYENRKDLEKELKSRYANYPVFLSKRDIKLFYAGFCNKTIWPLFHYFSDYAIYDKAQWSSYMHVNKIFAQAILKEAAPGDIIWIHDYHLMLLPRLIREKLPDAQIGFFLHIPFPSYEVFRLIPWRNEILNGLLGADLIGFHIYDYVRHFISSVRRILGYEDTFGQITHDQRITRVDAFPMGIEYDHFNKAESSTEWTQEFLEQCKIEGVCRIILSVDRLDYTKGIPQRLRAYDYFLEKYPEYKKKVTLILVAVPSRTGVEKYQDLKKEVDELIGRINGKHGTIGWMPVWYFYRFMDFKHLTALYRIADVAMITPLRDGMNLIAKEYIATRNDDKGVLILSEMAGAVSEMAESIIVNPNNKDEIADAIQEALQLPEKEQIERNQIMKQRLKRYNVVAWAEDFMERLRLAASKQDEFNARILTRDTYPDIRKAYAKASRRLIFLDYDGTLVPLSKTPGSAKPGSRILGLLGKLIREPANHVVIISGRDRHTLDKWLGPLECAMSAEHGVWIKDKDIDWQMLEPVHDEWKSEIRPILENYMNRTPGSMVEEKSFSLVWNYRKTDTGLGAERAKELKDALIGLTSNLNLVVTEGSKVIEIKHGSVNKGRAAMHWLSKNNWDFILAMGDDWTDEDLFEAMPESAWTMKIGVGISKAKYYLHNHVQVRELITLLTSENTDGNQD